MQEVSMNIIDKLLINIKSKHFNSFELGLFKRALQDEKILDKDEKREIEIEKLLEEIDEDSEEYNNLKLISNALLIKSQKITETIFMEEYLPTNTYASDEFILFNYGYNKDIDRYRKDIVYKSRLDLSDGFYKIVKIYQLLDELKNRKNKSFFRKNSPYRAKTDEITNLSYDYKILILFNIKKGHNLEESINNAIDNLASRRDIERSSTIDQIIEQFKKNKR
jgi:hypothetical protein